VSLRDSVGVFALLLLILVAYSILSSPQKALPVDEPKENFSFDMSVLEYGVLDSDNAMHSRAFITAQVSSGGVDNATVTMLLLGSKTTQKVYRVIDYHSSKEKMSIADSVEKKLLEYGIEVETIYLQEAKEIDNAVIILPSDAMPDKILSEGFVSILDGNAVVFFGKPLDIVMDHSGSQSAIGSQLYDELNLTYNEREGLISSIGGAHIHKAGNAQVAEYENGWLVVYEDLVSEEYSDEIAALVLEESWQSEVEKTVLSQSLAGGTEAISLYSEPFEKGDYYFRILSESEAGGNFSRQLLDLGLLRAVDDKLMIADVSGSSAPLLYSFELYDELSYPMMFDLSLRFYRDGEIVDTVPAESISMKTISRESGSVEAELGSGDYVVRLIDQDGKVHASAYTHVSEVDIELIRIAGADHVFLITVDGEPAKSVPVILTANGNAIFEMHTDKKGEIRKTFSLAEGTHTFSVEVGGESGMTYYRKGGAGLSGILYLVMLVGGAFVVVAIALRSKGGRKWKIKTHLRPAANSKTLKISYETFIEIFKRTQEDRAIGLPISVSDLRIGMHKHTVFKGSPVFLTDSNLYHILDLLVKKGRFLSYRGFFLPTEMTGKKPIEYWVLKRRLSDYFIERGEELPQVKSADFKVRGKMLHIWKDLDPTTLASLCTKADNIIIFPDEKKKREFIRSASSPDPSWVKVLLEIQYGRIYCQTLDEFLERGLYGKG